MLQPLRNLALLLLPCLALTAAAAVGDAPSAVATTGPDGQPRLVLANRFLELTFDPARGGRCIRFGRRDNGEQLVAPGREAGMFLDHWAKYPWPSALMHLSYRYELVNDGAVRAGVRLWVTVPAKGGGKGSPDAAQSAQIATSPELIGLVVRKTVWLSADNDCVVVDQEVENPTRESRSVAPYIQHNLVANGARFGDNWYLPSSRGVVVNVQPDREGGRAIGPDWVLDPTAGWIAVLDRATRRGLLFAFDYNYIEKLYTCGQTAEWFLATVPVGPGKTFKTSYVIKPLKDFEDVAYGSARVTADLRARERGRRVRVDHDLAAVRHELEDVAVEIKVVGWRSKRELTAESYTLPALGFEPVRHSFTFTPDALKDGVVIQTTVRAGGSEDRYERFYAGDRDAHERRYNYFATKGGALAGAKGDAYSLKPPRKTKTFEKPDFAKIARPATGRFRCLVIFGLYTQMLNLDDALAPWRPGGRLAPEFTWANCPPNAVETFPGSYDELFGHNLVVLGDVNAKAVGDIGFEMLCDYVEQGGALLVTGGPYALGNGEFAGMRFLDVLPVTLSGPFDLKWAGKGQSWPLEPVAADSPLLTGVAFADTPRVYWRHVVTPKPETTVVLEAGGRPALVLGRYGRGRVAVLTLSPTGEGAAGETSWWAWPGWPPLARNLGAWLTEGTR